VRNTSIFWAILVVSTLALSASGAHAAATITLTPGTTYQTMTGWEVHGWHGEPDCAEATLARGTVFDKIVNELGITRIRLEVRSGAENPVDYYAQMRAGQIPYDTTWKQNRYAVINDNGDPNSMNAAGFHFTELDYSITTNVLPMKQRVEARGEQLYINLNYVAFGSGNTVHAQSGAEYAELMLAVFQHMDATYGFVPDGIEIMLEPDNAGWTYDKTQVGVKLGNAIVATKARLAANGYNPEIIAPSAMNPVANHVEMWNGIESVPGAAAAVDEISYHRYVTASTIPGFLPTVKADAQAVGARTSMLEHIGSATNDLYDDLTIAHVSSWQQFTAAACGTTDDGGTLLQINPGNPPTVTFKSRTKLLLQYFEYVRPGAVRYRATSSTSGVDPVAFRNADGKHVVVVRTGGAQDLTITGLPAGTYGAYYADGVDNGWGVTVNSYDNQLPDKTITSGQALTVSIPVRGIITVYAKSGGGSCTDTSWNPSATGKCGTVAQTSNCGNTRTITGTVTCTAQQTCQNSVCVAIPDTTPPSAVTNVQSTVTSTSVSLTWSAATDNVGVTSYEIRRGTTLAATTAATAFTDNGRTPGTTYTYSVTAKDAAGNSGSATTKSATTSAAAPVCGNNIVEIGEQCDLGSTGNGACPKTCSATCTTNTCAPTQTCGNGVKEGTEQCDGVQLGGATCTTQGFTGGVLGCSPSCTISTSACTGAPTIGTAPSPTGRNPQFLWTPQQQWVWQQMKAEYDANPSNPQTNAAELYKLLKDNADCNCRYSDTGLWDTIMYQITGDAAYAQKAWNKWSSGTLFTNPTAFKGNTMREHGIESVLIYDWLYPSLTPTQRQTFIDRMNTALAAEGLDNTRTTDTDATTGEYFTAAMFYMATKDVNPNAASVFNHAHVGGFTPTASDMSTLRNAIQYYSEELAEGGEWMESSEYNLGTTVLLTMGYESMKTATAPTDYYPEVGALLPKLAERDTYAVTPDLNQVYQWGDEQEPRSFTYVFRRMTNEGALQGATQGTPESARLHSLMNAIMAKYGASGYGSAEPWARFFLFYNPYAATVDWRTSPLWRYAPGQALLLRRDGFQSQDSLFGAQFLPEKGDVDHTPMFFGNFQLYRAGQWTITHPITYNLIGTGVDGGVNQMIIEGLPQWHGFLPGSEYHKVRAVRNDVDFSYLVGTMGGQSRPAGYYDPPPTFLHEHTRSVLYLPSTNDQSDVIVVFDRVNSENPLTLPKSDRYHNNEKTGMASSIAEGRKQFVLHAPVKPTTTSTGFQWTQGSQTVDVKTLLPSGVQPWYVDEKIRYSSITSFDDNEKNWQTRLVSNNDWETFLNVIIAKESSYTANAQLISGAGVSGALVTRSGQPDLVAVFNAKPSAKLPADNTGANWKYDSARVPLLDNVRLRQSGFTFSWSASNAVTTVLLFDLDPSIVWTYKIGSGAYQSLSVDANGIARVALSGTGAKTLEVAANGVAPPPSSVCGNNIVEAGEACDNGISNGACPATCSASCSVNSCGNAPRVGDVNADGSVTIADVMQVASKLGNAPNGAVEDMNADGKINVYDIVLVAKLV
jgi:hypothetical protein